MNSTPQTTVRWRAEDGHANVWALLRPAPVENRGFIEARSYVFQKPPGSYDFAIDDEPLTDDPGDPSLWRWKPGFFAGEVTAELIAHDGRTAGLFLLDVSPDPAKLGRDVFGQMVEELWHADPSLVVGTEPATRQIGSLGGEQDPWSAFARLRRYVPDVLRAVESLRRKPLRVLRVRRLSAPLHHVRRIDRQTLTSLVRSPAVALLFSDVQEVPSMTMDSRLDVPWQEESLDAAANRAVLALLQALIRRARALHVRLEELVTRERVSATRTTLNTRWPARKRLLLDLTAQLTIATRRSPFPDVRRAEITPAGLTALSADPIYARVWNRGWRALRQGIDSGERTERLWISPSWEIYERWCFLHLGTVLSAVAPAWGWRRAKNPDRWIGSRDGRTAELRLQPTFQSDDAEREGRWSISRERVPDLALTVTSLEGTRFVLLDAKYRTSRSNVLDAMASAHIYQDSLRMGARRPDASLLFVPAGGGASWLENKNFHATHRVGVHVMAPDVANKLPAVVADMLGP